MPQVAVEQWVAVDPATAFAVSQTTGELRLRWDPFISRQSLIEADRPGVGVRTRTRSRLGLSMISRYASYRPPTSVGMSMVSGPWFFAGFGGGWRFEAAERDGVSGTSARWKYAYAIRPRLLRPIAEPIGQWLLGREIRARIDAFAGACADREIVRGAVDQALGFEPGQVDQGGGGELAAAMAAEIALLYDGLDHNGPDMPKAGPAELGPPGGGFWVGRVAGVPVCCGGLKRLPDEGAGAVAEIKKMYVVPQWRGRGVARRLLGFLEDRAREMGYDAVRLDTGPAQPHAQALYTASGYAPIDNFNQHPVATYFGEKALRRGPG